MPEAQESPIKCPHCGHLHPTAAKTCAACAACGAVMSASPPPPAADDWSVVRDSLKTRWVAAVMAFWVSALVLAVMSFVGGGLNLVLASICLGLLIVGLWLKARYQLHLRKGPSRH